MSVWHRGDSRQGSTEELTARGDQPRGMAEATGRDPEGAYKASGNCGRLSLGQTQRGPKYRSLHPGRALPSSEWGQCQPHLLRGAVSPRGAICAPSPGGGRDLHHVGTPFPEVCPVGTEPETGFLGPPAAQPCTHPGASGKIFTAHSPHLQHAAGTGRPRKILRAASGAWWAPSRGPLGWR